MIVYKEPNYNTVHADKAQADVMAAMVTQVVLLSGDAGGQTHGDIEHTSSVPLIPDKDLKHLRLQSPNLDSDFTSQCV